MAEIFPHSFEILTDQVISVSFTFFDLELGIIEFHDLVEGVLIIFFSRLEGKGGFFLPRKPWHGFGDELELAATFISQFDEMGLLIGDHSIICVDHALSDEEAVFDGLEDILGLDRNYIQKSVLTLRQSYFAVDIPRPCFVSLDFLFNICDFLYCNSGFRGHTLFGLSNYVR